MSNNISKQEEERYEELQLIALDFARNGNTRELEKMLKHGMSVNLCTSKYDSLIMLSSYKGHLETTKMLIEKGADINKLNARGQTPLDGVCFKGDLRIAKLLVENGANTDGNSIMLAAIFGNKDIVSYLKEKRLHKKSLRIFGVSVEFISSFMFFMKSIFRIKNPIGKRAT